MDQKPNVRAETKKLMKESLDINFHYLELGNFFFDVTSKAQETTTIKQRVFCLLNSTHKALSIKIGKMD